jgi:branched-chain amino acid transport system substrate-binding protein
MLVAPAQAQSDKPLKIGVLTDLTSVYSDIGGKGNIEAAKMQGDRVKK